MIIISALIRAAYWVFVLLVAHVIVLILIGGSNSTILYSTQANCSEFAGNNALQGTGTQNPTLFAAGETLGSGAPANLNVTANSTNVILQSNCGAQFATIQGVTWSVTPQYNVSCTPINATIISKT